MIVYNLYFRYLIFMIIFFIIEFLLHLAFTKRSIEITKDENQKKLNIKVTSYLCCNRENHDFDLENVIFNVILQGGTYTLVVINNYKKNNGMDLYMNEINNKPAKIFLHYRNINVLKFNGEFALINLLNNFVGVQGNQENQLNFDIYSHMKKANLNQNIISKEKNIKYLKINDHFFTYFSKNPISLTKYDGLLLKIISGLFHTFGVLNYAYAFFVLKGNRSLFEYTDFIFHQTLI